MKNMCVCVCWHKHSDPPKKCSRLEHSHVIHVIHINPSIPAIGTCLSTTARNEFFNSSNLGWRIGKWIPNLRRHLVMSWCIGKLNASSLILLFSTKNFTATFSSEHDVVQVLWDKWKTDLSIKSHLVNRWTLVVSQLLYLAPTCPTSTISIGGLQP